MASNKTFTKWHKWLGLFWSQVMASNDGNIYCKKQSTRERTLYL